MLLAAAGNDGQLGEGRGQEEGFHTTLVALGEGQPLAIYNEMAVVAHALGFHFANDGSQFRAGFVEPEEAIQANDIARLQLIVIGEGGLDPFVEGDPLSLLFAAKATDAFN